MGEKAGQPVWLGLCQLGACGRVPHTMVGAVRQGVKTGTGGEPNIQFPPLQWSLGPKIPQSFTTGPVVQTHKPVWDISDSNCNKVSWDGTVPYT